jgi:TRAP-type C4-dicarboxylate transport system substrate-binding protein
MSLSGCGKKAEEPAKAGETIKLTYANFPPPATFPCVQMERWVDEVEMRTDGRVSVDTFPGSTLLNPKNTFDGVIAGTADIGCLAMSYQPGKFPVSEAVDLPVGFASAKAASLALYDLIEKYKPKEFEKVKILTLFTCPPASFMTTTPVKSLADLEGMELRCSGTGVGVIERLGGTPIAMPMSETPNAIQRGVVKGIVSSMEILKDFNFVAYCPYATRIGDTSYVVTFAVVMNKEKWDSLPADVKKVMDELSREQALWTGTYVDNHTEEALKWAKQEHEHQVFDLPEEEEARIPELLQPMIDEYIEKTNAAGLPGDEIIKDVYRLKEEHEK